jgi:MFS family permease
MRTYQLWLLVLSFFLYWGIGCYLVLAHQVKFAQNAGYSSMFAASVFALFGIFVAVGQLSASISDWIGREKTISLGTILAIGSLVALVSVQDTSQPWLLYVYATGFGFGAGFYAPTIFAGTANIFHGRHFGAISGLVLTGMGIGGAIGPWLGGHIYDISGSYSTGFFLMYGVLCPSLYNLLDCSAQKCSQAASQNVKLSQTVWLSRIWCYIQFLLGVSS